MQNTNFRTGYNIPNYIYYHQPVLFFEHKWSLFKSRERSLWFYKYIYPFFVRLFLNDQTKIFVQLNFIKEGFVRKFNFPEDRIFIVSPKLNKPSVDIPNTLALSAQKINLFYPAQPLFYKNHQILFEALSRINDSKFSLYLTQCKSEDFPITLPCAIDVHFLGKVSLLQLEELYIRADALLFPSYIETFGLPLTEAAGVGTKIIASDLPYAREVLDGYAGADFVPYYDVEKWVEKIFSIKKQEKYMPIKISNRGSWETFFDIIKQRI